MLKLIAIIAIISGLVFFFALAGFAYYSTSTAHYQTEQHQSNKEKKPENQHSFRGFINFLFPDAISIFTFWLVIATVALSVVAIVQIEFLRRAEHIADQSAHAAKESADATKSAVELSDRTAERQLRAYVSLVSGSVSLTNLREGGIGIQIHVQLRNSGQTPAYKFTTWIKPPEILPPDALPFTPPVPIEERTGSSILGPGADAHINWVMPSTPDLREAIEMGTKRVFIWGGADFTDSLGKERHFIFRDVNSPGPNFRKVGDGLAIQPHKQGYDAN